MVDTCRTGNPPAKPVPNAYSPALRVPNGDGKGSSGSATKLEEFEMQVQKRYYGSLPNRKSNDAEGLAWYNRI